MSLIVDINRHHNETHLEFTLKPSPLLLERAQLLRVLVGQILKLILAPLVVLEARDLHHNPLIYVKASQTVVAVLLLMRCG